MINNISRIIYIAIIRCFFHVIICPCECVIQFAFYPLRTINLIWRNTFSKSQKNSKTATSATNPIKLTFMWRRFAKYHRLRVRTKYTCIYAWEIYFIYIHICIYKIASFWSDCGVIIKKWEMMKAAREDKMSRKKGKSMPA